MSRETSPENLVERAKGGDRTAFDDLVLRYQERVQRYLGSRLGERLRKHASVEDLSQDVFFRALRSLSGFQWENEKAFEGWLFAIADNVVLYAAQKNRRANEQIPDQHPAGDPSPSKNAQRDERFERLQQALLRLSPEYRNVLLLAKIERLRIKEIAVRTGRSEVAVKQLIARGLRKLRACFGDTESLNLPDRQFQWGENNSSASDPNERE